MQKKKTRTEKVLIKTTDGQEVWLEIECYDDEEAYLDLSQDKQNLVLKKRKKGSGPKIQ